MKMFRKLLCAALLVALIVATMTTGLAATKYFYMSNGYYTSGSISIPLTKNSKITSVKSSNTGVMKVSSLWQSTTVDEDFDENKTTKRYSADIYVGLLKKGSATLTYKLDGVKKSQKVVVKKYSNPVRSLVLSGYGSKNLKSLFAKEGNATLTLTKNAKAGKLTVKAASGWRISSGAWYDNETYAEYDFYAPEKGASSFTLSVPKMAKGGDYSVEIDFVNTSTKGALRIALDIY